jgi:hypothetical protein
MGARPSGPLFPMSSKPLRTEGYATHRSADGKKDHVRGGRLWSARFLFVHWFADLRIGNTTGVHVNLDRDAIGQSRAGN